MGYTSTTNYGFRKTDQGDIDWKANEDYNWDLLDGELRNEYKDWLVSGALSVIAEVNGVWIVPRALTIMKAYIYCKTTGSAGDTIVDVNVGGTTIFTTQANRPTLNFADSDKKAVSGAPDVTALVEGDVVSIDIDQIATGAADLSVVLICK